MTAVRLVFALFLLAFPAAAQAQAFWGHTEPSNSGERIALQWAYIGDEPGTHYSHIVYAAARSRPEGYWWFMFRNGCRGQEGYSTSWGFVRWDDGSQSADRLFDLFPSRFEPALTHVVQCGGAQGTGPMEGRDLTLQTLHYWQRMP